MPASCRWAATSRAATATTPSCSRRSSAEREGRLRADVARVTGDLAVHLEELIRADPQQWHLQQPNWPSDYDALEAIGKPHPRPAVGPSAAPSADPVH